MGSLGTRRVVEDDRPGNGQRSVGLLAAVALRRHPPANALPLASGVDVGGAGGGLPRPGGLKGSMQHFTEKEK